MGIRKANQEDKKNILDIVGILYIDMPGFVWNKEEFVEKQIKKGEYFIAESDDGKTMGIVSFRQRGEKMYIETLVVAKEHQSQGVGRSLVEFAKEHTKKNDVHFLCACAFLEYDTAGFYLKQGFNLLEMLGSYGGHKYYRFQMEV